MPGSERKRGRIAVWHADKSWGWISGNDGSSEFCHVRDLRHRDIRPAVGDGCSYSIGSHKGRACATDVAIDGAEGAAADKQPTKPKPPSLGDDVFGSRTRGLDFADR
jgi:cold shock CspA family protein